MTDPNGYHRLAEWIMGPFPEAAIFRKFSPLAMINLLSLQAELIDLEDEFQRIRYEDDQSNDPKERNFSRYFRDLHQSEGGGRDHQYQMLLQIRRKLNEYYAALLQASQISKLGQPTTADLEFLRGWIAGPKEGGNFLQIAELFTWEAAPDADPAEKKRLERDLVTLHVQPTEQDPASQFVTSRLLGLYHWIWGSRSSARKQNKTTDHLSGAMHYQNESLLRLNTIAISVVSSAMPVVSIIALYYIKSTIQRIGALVAFTTLFALALATFTNARRLEIFATTST
ncbi:hypothetical protein PRZ48_006126 [Zasmidium cellare]|uniref:DUF6594 domain-containing protein n=1 Tax=Zasmidium cellare TaxID=395010 RepID=A0ABR0EMK2_ZASCE|nr:hypothetical protein PRZ48_006126 [Zasmidium cellare]